MANRKLKNFEFANHSEIAKGREVNTDQLEFFECPNGSVFLICLDDSSQTPESSPALLANQRIRYYLENEFVEKPGDALYNALIYTNGFIYEYGRKNPEYANASVHCAVMLIRNGRAWYVTLGETALFFFNGKKPYMISQGAVAINPSPVKELQQADTDLLFLGRNKEIDPLVNTKALVPLNGDMVLMASQGFYKYISDKNLAKILEDPMPVQTKVYRLVDMASVSGSEDAISVQLISFYNLDNTERFFVPVEPRKTKPIKKVPVSDKTTDAATSSETSGNPYVLRAKEYLSRPLVRVLLLLLFVTLVSYMVYDIFIRDPMPPVRVALERPTEIIQSEEPAVEEMQPTSQTPAVAVSIPEDRVYLVRSGDTWGRIYSQFGVCSWFIRTHPVNEGKFDSDENPIAGTRINIPVIYSARQELNPDFFREFTIQKTGSRCENANEEFLERFRRDHL